MNTFGKAFSISIFGESHGDSVGIVIDGVPAGLPLKPEDFNADLARRRSGAKGTTPRQERDEPRIMSGVFRQHTTGAPLMVLFQNSDVRSKDYSHLVKHPRPGHADLTAQQKFGGFQDYRGGGHFSGRLTLGLIAAGTIAKKMIAPLRVEASLLEAGGSTAVEAAVDQAIQDRDSIGGIVGCVIDGVPAGLGEPFFDSVEALLGHILFSIPGIKGLEFGAGFGAARMRGSEHNDNILDPEGQTETNHAGGINGGISNGNPIVFRVAVKPTSSTHQVQHTLNLETGRVEPLSIEGRHDTCIALRVPVVVEAAASIVMADLMLQSQKIKRVQEPKAESD
ncbi:MAG: chorismate synthase [Bacteroidetes bacterium]|nr:MAG: chorismate synthase [Bacteroidota bacterium]